MSFGPDGTAALFGHHTVRMWDLFPRRPIGAPLHVPGLGSGPDPIVSGNGRRLATFGHHTARLWNATSGRPVGAVMRTPVDLQAMALNGDGTLMAGGEHSGQVRLWDTVTGRPVGAPLQTRSGWALGVVAMAFSPGDRLLVGGTGDGKVWVWNLATGQPVEVAHRQVTSSGRSAPPDWRSALMAGFWPSPAPTAPCR